MKTYFCDGCGSTCGLEVIDEGIGGYEFWGARGHHSDLVVYSDCCQDIVVDSDTGEEISQESLFEDIEENRKWDV